MRSNVDIYEFEDHRSYFNAVVQNFQNEKFKPSSLGEWGMRLGYRSPRSFGMILSGQRLPSDEFLERFSEYLKLTKRENEYLRELVNLEKCKNKERPVEDILKNLQRLNPRKSTFQTFDLVQFNFISGWYHLVLKQLFTGMSLGENYELIKKGMRNKISVGQIKEAISNLITLGLIRKEGEQLVATNQDFNTTNDIPSEAIKSFHNGMLERARESLYEQPVEQREFQSLTLKIDDNNLEEAKQFIRDFKEDFNQRFSNNDGFTEIYQLNIQFFSHTDLKKAKIPCQNQ